MKDEIAGADLISKVGDDDINASAPKALPTKDERGFRRSLDRVLLAGT